MYETIYMNRRIFHVPPFSAHFPGGGKGEAVHPLSAAHSSCSLLADISNPRAVTTVRSSYLEDEILC